MSDIEESSAEQGIGPPPSYNEVISQSPTVRPVRDQSSHRREQEEVHAPNEQDQKTSSASPMKTQDERPSLTTPSAAQIEEDAPTSFREPVHRQLSETSPDPGGERPSFSPAKSHHSSVLSLPPSMEARLGVASGEDRPPRRVPGNMRGTKTRSVPSLMHAGISSGAPLSYLPRTTSWQSVVDRVTSFDGPDSPGASADSEPPCDVVDRVSVERPLSASSSGHPGRFINTAYSGDEDIWELRKSQNIEMSELSRENQQDMDNGNAPELETSFRYGASPPPVVDTSPRYRSSYRAAFYSISESAERDVEQGCCPRCGDCGPFRAVCSTCRGRVPKGVVCRILLLVLAVVAAVCFAVFCSSFVYVEYHQIALVRTKSTGAVNLNTVYPGCYVLGPDKEFQHFQSTVYHLGFNNVGVFSGDGMPVEISFSVGLKLRSKEIGLLYSKFKLDFLNTFKPIIVSEVKNTVPLYKVDEFRYSRNKIQENIHDNLSSRFGGNCCPDCCTSDHFPCPTRKICSTCLAQGHSLCEQAYHADVAYFHLSTLTLNDDLMNRYLTRLVLQVQAETEVFVQDYQVTVKEIDRDVQEIMNQANVVKAKGTATAAKIRAFAEADREKTTQLAETQALQSMCDRLNVTQEDHKMSLYMIHTLENLPHLYRSEGFDKNSLYQPSP